MSLCFHFRGVLIIAVRTLTEHVLIRLSSRYPFTPVIPAKGFFFKFTLVREVIICRGDLFHGSYLLSSLSYRSHSGQSAKYLPIRNCRDTTVAICFLLSRI